MLSFKEFLLTTSPRFYKQLYARRVDDVVVIKALGHVARRGQVLSEGKWLSAEYEDDIRIDRNAHQRTGEKHAHFHDRKGNETYAMTADGRLSHGSQPFRLTKAQAEALAGQGFTIPPNKIVEGVLVGVTRLLLLG